MSILTHQDDVWSKTELFLDLFQEKLLKLQKYYDLSVSERDALETENVERLEKVFHEKDVVQKQIGEIDVEVEQIHNDHQSLMSVMDQGQQVEFRNFVNLMVSLLQKIIDYEERNKAIAIDQKDKIQKQLNEVANGDKMLKGYFSKNSMSPKYINQAR